MDNARTLTEVSATITAVADTLRGLPAVLDRARQDVQVLEEQHAFGAGGGGDAEVAVSGVLRALLNAEQAVQVARVHLREAGAPLGALGVAGGRQVGAGELETADSTR